MSTQIELSEVFAQAAPSEEHGFLISTKFAAAGYGVADSTIRGHKRDRPDELVEGVHWVRDGQSVNWTARGIIQLGFCTQSSQGAEFRAWAEQKLMKGGSPEPGVCQTDAPKTLPVASVSTIDSTAEAIAEVVVGQLSTEQILSERVSYHVQAKLDSKVAAVDPDALGKGIAAQWGLQNLAALTHSISQLTQQEVTAE